MSGDKRPWRKPEVVVISRAELEEALRTGRTPSQVHRAQPAVASERSEARLLLTVPASARGI